MKSLDLQTEDWIAAIGSTIISLILVFIVIWSLTGCTYHVTGHANIAIPNQGQAGVNLEFQNPQQTGNSSMLGRWFK